MEAEGVKEPNWGDAVGGCENELLILEVYRGEEDLDEEAVHVITIV